MILKVIGTVFFMGAAGFACGFFIGRDHAADRHAAEITVLQTEIAVCHAVAATNERLNYALEGVSGLDPAGLDLWLLERSDRPE